MSERHRLQPIDADMNAIRFIAAGDVEVLAARSTAAGKNGVEALPEQFPHAVDRRAVADIGAHVRNLRDLLVEHRFRQTERGNIGAHQPARPVELLKNRDRVSERKQIVGNGQRGRTRADAGYTLAVFCFGNRRQQIGDFSSMIRRDALQTANRHRLAVQAPAAASGLARPVASAPQNRREDVRLPVQHIGLCVTAQCDQPDIFRHIGVRRTGPLAIDDFMKVVRISDVGGFQSRSPGSSGIAPELGNHCTPCRLPTG